MAKLVKVKGHKRADGTRVTSYKRKMQGFQSENRQEHSRAKGRLARLIREGADKESIRSVKRGVKALREDVGYLKRTEKGRYRRGRKRIKNTNRKSK